MNLPYFIARRYFISRRKKNFINIISLLSMIGVAIATAALIIVLSVFNGLEVLLSSLYTSFDPELKIEAAKGKSFEATDELIHSIEKVPGVKIITQVIEDYAYVRYRDADVVVTLKGVSDNFIDQHRLDEHITEGELQLWQDSIPLAIIGRDVRYILSAEVTDDTHALQIFYIRNVKSGTTDPSRMYARKSIRPGSVFSIEKNYDGNYIFVPLRFAEELLNYGNKRTSLEIQTTGMDVHEVQNGLRSTLGDKFVIKTNQEQHEDIFRLLKFEKLFSFLALSLLLLIGSINIFFSLMMLAIDKKKDISILTAVGGHPSLIKRIFLTEGMIISITGATIGLLLGATLCYLQEHVGLVGMGMENAIVTNYPVRMRLTDFALTSLVIVGIAFLVSFRPAILASKSYSIDQL
ncbi:MAG TPA: FtsX-like permease family protein [Cyclobacteriaceae bacterium]|nr:FtsX-like permease family protein [Cyclobacteriaceae bacterium]